MGNEVAVKEIRGEYREQTVEGRFEFARRLAAAGDMLPAGLKGQITNPQTGEKSLGIVPGKVFLITETARMLGIDPMAGLQGINVIEGSASIAPSLMQALVRRAGHKLRVRSEGSIAGGDMRAVATLVRNDDPEPFEVVWTPHDAVQAGLADSYKPDDDGVWKLLARSREGNPLAWEKYTRQLLKWRAQSEVVRDGAEEVLLGVHYTPEELGAVVREDGTEYPQTVDDVRIQQAELLTLIKDASSKPELVEIWEQWNESDAWIGKPEADYYVKLGSFNVEDAEVVEDDPTEQAPAEAAQGPADDVTPSASESPSDSPEAADGRTAPQTEAPELDWEAAERAEYDRAVAAGEIQP